MSEEKNGTCTCGQCFEGWLSPKMRECLECKSHLAVPCFSRHRTHYPRVPRAPCPFPDSAEVRYQLAKSLLDTQEVVVGEEITGVLPIDPARIDLSVRYLPDALRARLRPEAGGRVSIEGDTMYRGYVGVFKAIRDLVAEGSEDRDGGGDGSSSGDSDHKLKLEDVRVGFPSVSAVAAKLQAIRALKDGRSRYVAMFLQHGGRAEHALDCVVDRAREELTPLGRQYDSEKRYIDAMFAGEHKECANDLDFALVRAKLGLPVETLGVHPDDEDEEEDLRDPPSDDEE